MFSYLTQISALDVPAVLQWNPADPGVVNYKAIQFTLGALC